MVRLLVIADDFTGALDTGVQFRTGKSLVIVYSDNEPAIREYLRRDLEVLIVDTETRHLEAEQAGQIIGRITKNAVDMGVPYIYKKTDSGMRGNIGSELTAFWKASGEKQIHYFPAFPQMGRITRGGIHYIDGVPVAESVFGHDPFEPVRSSAVKDIIGQQSIVPVTLVSGNSCAGEEEGILVYDSSTDEEMYRQGTFLKDNHQLHLLAGCAGFASVLFRLLGFRTSERKQSFLSGKILVICGSLNEVTVKQLDFASARGMSRVSLGEKEKLGEAWPDSVEGILRIRHWEKILEQTNALIVECGVKEREQTSKYAFEIGLSQDETRMRIAAAMGGILKQMLDDGVRSTLVVTGGDTLLAFMQQIDTNVLEPVDELFPGVVLSHLEYQEEKFDLITKSGGFGQEDLIIRLQDLTR